MAIQSVTQTAQPERCKHDTEMVNEVNARLCKIKAVTDLMLSNRGDDLDDTTMSNIGWLLMGMLGEVHQIVNAPMEAQS